MNCAVTSQDSSTDADTFLEPFSRAPSQEFTHRDTSHEASDDVDMGENSYHDESESMYSYELCNWFLYLYKEPDLASSAL